MPNSTQPLTMRQWFRVLVIFLLVASILIQALLIFAAPGADPGTLLIMIPTTGLFIVTTMILLVMWFERKLSPPQK
jgi:hypothetical protein